ncbi:biotin/lipoyl-containing protein, partial [Embleya sp. NPDC056538]
RLLTATHGPTHLVEVDGVTHRVGRDEGGVVRSPAPALVVATPLAVGDEVEAGAPVLVLESMKMETVLRAPFRARLKECSVSVGSQVETGAPLLRLEPLADDDGEAEDTTAGASVELDLPAAPETVPVRARTRRGQEDLRSLLLGFDVDPHDERRVLDDYLAARTAAAEAGHRPLVRELELIEMFTDLAELSRNRPAGEDVGGDGHLHSAREYFHSYLQSLDVERAGLPPAFRAKLAKALAHYGVTEPEPSPELEAAVFRIFLAQQRASADAAVIATLLRSWLREAPPDATLHEPAGLALERLIGATQVRFPVLADLARGVVYDWFGRPLLRRNRARVYAGVRKHLRHLDAHPDTADRAERVAEMVRSTEPLVRLLGQRLVRDNLDNATMLEVLTRRYYGNKGLTDVRTREIAGCTFVVAERAGSSLVSAAVGFEALGGALRGLAELAADGNPIDADIYLSWENQPESADATAAALHEVVAAQPLPPRVRRLTTTVAGRGGAVMHHHFTFRPSDTGMVEERLIRGLHPYIAQRMQLERLSKFDLT